jgi:hypothetical protein
LGLIEWNEQLGELQGVGFISHVASSGGMIVNLSGVDVVIWWEVPKLVGETS